MNRYDNFDNQDICNNLTSKSINELNQYVDHLKNKNDLNFDYDNIDYHRTKIE